MLASMLQAVPVPSPSWVPPTIAISTALIAFVLLALLTGAAIAVTALHRALERMTGNMEELHRDLAAVLDGARRVTAEGESLVHMVREEGHAYLATSRRFRRRLDRGVDRVTERMADLDALVDVVHEEVEDSAMQFATALRTARLSTGIIAKVLRRRRRK